MILHINDITAIHHHIIFIKIDKCVRALLNLTKTTEWIEPKFCRELVNIPASSLL